jgi:hypothetical protein
MIATAPGGHTLHEIQVGANISTWNDATTSGALESGLFTPGTAAYAFWSSSSMTIAEYFKKNPTTKAEASLTISALSGNIYFDPSYLNHHSVGFDAALLMHEVIHTLGWDDDQLKSALGIPSTRASGAITDLLAKDCFGVNR